VLLISFLNRINFLEKGQSERRSKLFIQTVYLEYVGEGEEREFPMKLSQEFAEKFSEIFLEDTMADFFTINQDSR
jgi:hypothetical protein